MPSQSKELSIFQKAIWITGFLASGDNFTIPCFINWCSPRGWEKSYWMAFGMWEDVEKYMWVYIRTRSRYSSIALDSCMLMSKGFTVAMKSCVISMVLLWMGKIYDNIRNHFYCEIQKAWGILGCFLKIFHPTPGCIWISL